jgi:phosphopantetheinyl transferase
VAIDVYRIRLDAQATAGCADRALHAILRARLGSSVELVRDANGKPHVAGVHFNVSHSSELAVIAVSDAAVGVDVEQHRAIADPSAFARRFHFAAVDPLELMRLWCRKEAWLKARGIGLAGVTERVDVRAAPPGWFIADLELAPGYAAAVAREGEPADVRIVDYIDDSAASGAAIIARKIST